MAVKGSRIGFCPLCKLNLPHWFLVLDNTQSTQRIGYVCSGCDHCNISMERSRKNGRVIKRYKRPGFELYGWAKMQPIYKPGGKIIVPEVKKPQEFEDINKEISDDEV